MFYVLSDIIRPDKYCYLKNMNKNNVEYGTLKKYKYMLITETKLKL